MKKLLTGKLAIIILVALLLGFFDLPYQTQKKIIPWTPETLAQAKIQLGLDLQGGTHLNYKIDLRKVEPSDRKAIVEGVKEVINRRVNALGVSEPNIYISEVADEYHIVVELAGIKDIEEAKAIVGKIIQLEFKEKREEIDPQEKEKVKDKAQTDLDRIFKGEDFALVGEEEERANPGKAVYLELDYKFKDELGKSLEDKVFDLEIGEVYPELIEAEDEYTVDENGQLKKIEGFYLAKAIDKKDQERTIEQEKEVKASHILIAYQGAKQASSTITRTKEEAKERAEEVLAKIQTGEDLAFLAQEYSDDPGSKEKGGDLGFFKKGLMTEAFGEAAFALEIGEISDLVETEFGYHIIKVSEIKEAASETKVEPQIKLALIFFSAEPDPWKETGLTGQHFVHADVTFTEAYQPYVAIEFNAEGAKLFEEITERNVSKPLAIFVGGQLISAPRVNEKISGGRAQITGNFTIDEASNLARDLNTGAIPAPITLAGQYTIGATLGQDALNRSLKAGLIGILILMTFILFYYRLPGFLADLTLSIYIILLLFCIKAALPLGFALAIAAVIFAVIVARILKSTESGWEKLVSFLLACFVLFFITFVLSAPLVLTLAGVAGIILSIGMAVDANILIFERIKEELKEGRPLSSAIEVGFARAWSSIRDSNFSSLITCGILLYFGTSIIRGFAFNLALGILISMFSAITLTRTFLRALVGTKLGQKLWLFGLKKERKIFPFIKYRKIWFAFSGILIGLSILSAPVLGLKWGLDFTGGTLIEVQFENKEATAAQIQETLAEAEKEAQTLPSENSEEEEEPVDFGKPVILTAGDGYLIRMKHISEETHNLILVKFREKLGNFEEPRFTTIGPTIGKTLKQKALIALLIATIMIVLYLAFAFRRIPKHINPWSFGICAVLALIHDITITTGAFVFFGYFFGVEIDALFVTALLTILGFSVHDTIVVFDRVRENLKYQEKGETFENTTDRALNQTLARSINTSLTTLFTVAALAILGSASIRFFSLTLVVGIFIGTYSSIFVASPFLVLWRNWRGKKV